MLSSNWRTRSVRLFAASRSHLSLEVEMQRSGQDNAKTSNARHSMLTDQAMFSNQSGDRILSDSKATSSALSCSFQALNPANRDVANAFFVRSCAAAMNSSTVVPFTCSGWPTDQHQDRQGKIREIREVCDGCSHVSLDWYLILFAQTWLGCVIQNYEINAISHNNISQATFDEQFWLSVMVSAFEIELWSNFDLWLVNQMPLSMRFDLHWLTVSTWKNTGSPNHVLDIFGPYGIISNAAFDQ